MPELPEVETVRRGLAPVMEGVRVVDAEVRRANLRFALPEDLVGRLKGRTINYLGRRAKYLTFVLSSGEVLVVHLGMTGRFTVEADEGAVVAGKPANPKHDHIVIHLENGMRVTYNDPRRFGFFEAWPEADLDAYPAFAAMGPEPCSNAFHAPYLKAALKGRKSPIKSALLDQKIIAGLGNIYVCEALFRSGIGPEVEAGRIGGVRIERLVVAINDVIGAAIDAGGSSISDFAATDGALGYFQHSFDVYGREGQACKTCDRAIRRLVQSGRSTFYCSRCQK